jgi:hypothetical protein
VTKKWAASKERMIFLRTFEGYLIASTGDSEKSILIWKINDVEKIFDSDNFIPIPSLEYKMGSKVIGV